MLSDRDISFSVRQNYHSKPLLCFLCIIFARCMREGTVVPVRSLGGAEFVFSKDFRTGRKLFSEIWPGQSIIEA